MKAKMRENFMKMIMKFDPGKKARRDARQANKERKAALSQVNEDAFTHIFGLDEKD
jgi:hypothetical protein